jgi:hypothetical protein
MRPRKTALRKLQKQHKNGPGTGAKWCPHGQERPGAAGWLGNVVVIAPFWERKGSRLNAPVPFHGTGALPIQLQLNS